MTDAIKLGLLTKALDYIFGITDHPGPNPAWGKVVITSVVNEGDIGTIFLIQAQTLKTRGDYYPNCSFLTRP